MKTVKYYFAILILAASVSLPSCVSKKKFTGTEKKLQSAEKDNSRIRKDLNACMVNVSTLQTENNALENQNQSIKKQNELAQAEQAKRLKSLEDLINSQREATNRLRMAISEALIGFKPDQLSVRIVDGKIYVSLEEKLLFPSGSAVVNPDGKEAIGKLAYVLNRTADVKVMIEGHTDNVPIKTEKYNDNWDLSTARANAIVRVLADDYKVDPTRITSSGRGEFYPVKTNDTAEGRASNRRTEIILAPDLTELYKLMK